MISVIVPTKDRADDLETTLRSLIRQNIDDDAFEIVIVDNGSKDRTAVVSRDLGSIRPSLQIRYVMEMEPGLLAARHRGYREAEGNILVYADDDITAAPHWLSEIHRAIRESGADVVSGRTLPRLAGAEPSWLPLLWEKHPDGECNPALSLLDFGASEREVDPAYVWGLNMAIKKTELQRLRGFHPDGYPWELRHLRGDGEGGLAAKMARAGLRCLYAGSAEVEHRIAPKRLTIDYLRRRSFLEGISHSYSAYRLQERLPAAPTSNVSYIRRRAGDSLRSIQRHLLRSEAAALIDLLEKERRNGYEWHRSGIDRSPSLRTWILRPDYWDLPTKNLGHAGYGNE